MNDDQDERVLLARERTSLANERNRLANERTFLAWIRTGLASVAGGFAIIRFLTFHTFTHQLVAQTVGSILILLGMWIFAISFVDFKRSSQQLGIKGGIAGSLGSSAVITVVLFFVSFVMLFIAFKQN